MTTSFQISDRPINPNKEYLELKQQQYKQKKLTHEYLKKHQPFQQVLPCFRDNLAHLKSHENKKNKKNQKSKAQIYQEIKKKNLQKFGGKNKQQNQPTKVQKKTIAPSKMTVSYKPKDSIFIDTNEYKKKEKQNKDQVSESKQKQMQKTGRNFAGISQKQKYQKLLTVLQKEKQYLNQQKQDFEEKKQKLDFKKLVQKQQGVPFIKEIKKQIQGKKKLQRSHHEECKFEKQIEQLTLQNKMLKMMQSRNKGKNSKNTFEQNPHEIQSKIKQLQQQKQQIEEEVYRNKRQVVNPNDYVQTKYSLEKVNSIPAFDVESFRDFIDFKTLPPQENQFYKTAIEVFQTGLSQKQAKMKLKIADLDSIKQTQNKDENTVHYRRRFENDQRITKYNNGWIEVWTPGVQRLMGNKQLGYKVVWLRNGDIKQQWKRQKLASYYSKEKQVIKIEFDKAQPMYFFIKLSQLQQYDPVKRTKTVMFREGRTEIIDIDKDFYQVLDA